MLKIDVEKRKKMRQGLEKENTEWYSVHLYQAVWRWRGEMNMPSPSQISGTVSHRLKGQSQGTVHPTVTFIQHQPIDTILKKSQQKQFILSRVVWHIQTLSHSADVKSKTLILDGKGKKNHSFSFTKYSRWQHQCCQFWTLGLIIFTVFLKTRNYV